MSTSATPQGSSPSTAKLIGVAVIFLILLLLGLGQCGSAAENNSTANPSKVDETLPVAPVDSTTTPSTYEYKSSEPTYPSIPEPQPVAPPATTFSGESVYYPDCAAARAASAAPLYRGQAGYRSALDRDSDGVACEPYSGNSTSNSSGHSSSGSTSSGGSTYYANCSAARAAGAAPLHKGDPGYRSGLDRDNDGVACE